VTCRTALITTRRFDRSISTEYMLRDHARPSL
jgi:hypothetical protein